MHVFKFFPFGDKKKLAGISPLVCSTVHPTSAAPTPEVWSGDCRLAKLFEVLGVQDEQQCREIFTLISNQQRQQIEDGLGSFAISDDGGGEEEEEEEQQQQQEDIICRPHQWEMPISRSGTSIQQICSTAKASGEGHKNITIHHSNATPFGRGRQTVETITRSLSPEKHHLPSPQHSAAKEHTMAHPLPTPPQSSARNGISNQLHKHQISQQFCPASTLPVLAPLPKSLDRPLWFPQESGSTSEHVQHSHSACGLRKGDTIGWHSSATRQLQQVSSVQSPSTSRLPAYLLTDQSSFKALEVPCPPCSTPQNSPPRTLSHVHGLSSSIQRSLSVSNPLRSSSPSSSHRLSPPLTPMHSQPSNSRSPPCTPLIPTFYSQSPPQSPWSQLPRSSCPQPPSQSSWSALPRISCPRKWTKGARLGQGSFGTVYEGCNQEDGSFFAVKISNRDDSSSEIQQEVAVLSTLEHPNIVKYLGSSIEDGQLCIFLELVRMGSLESILRKYKRFEDNMIRTYTRQILHGLEYLHQKKTIHRDIKCANILVDVNGQVKLSDFGVAKKVDSALACSVKGTPLYMAPEVLTANKSHYGFPADIWSLGCTVLEMADGKPPWSDLEGFGFFFKVKRGEVPLIPKHLSPEGKDFIVRCMKFKPHDRPTATELLQHPFVANVPTPEPTIAWSPQSPVVHKSWMASSAQHFIPSASANFFLSSPGQEGCFVLAGAPRAHSFLHG